MKTENHYTPYRDHLFLTSTLCPYVVPTSIEGEIKAEAFAKMPLKARRSAYFIQAFSKTMARHPKMNAGFVKAPLLERGPKIHQFKEVAVALSVDKQINGERYPFMYIMRDSDKKTVQELDERLEFAVKSDANDVPEFKNFAKFMTLPSFARKQMMKLMTRNPDAMVAKMGTFNMTNISKWGLKRAVSHCPRVLISIGEMQNSVIPVTYSFNHVLVDGAQIGEFHQDVSKMIQTLDFN